MPSAPDNGDSVTATFVLLEILERGEQQTRDGKVRPAAEVLNKLRQQRKST
jgi:hypothetical protein